MAVGVRRVVTVPDPDVPTVAVIVGPAVAVGVRSVVTVLVMETGGDGEKDSDIVFVIDVESDVEIDVLTETDMLGVPDVVPEIDGATEAPMISSIWIPTRITRTKTS